MKFKSLYWAGLSAIALMAVSCSDNDAEYVPAEPVTTPEAYFDPTESYSFELGEDDTNVTVYAYRANGEGELTVPLTATAPIPNAFKAPSTVTFADGETKAAIDIAVVPTNMEGVKDYVYTLTLGDGKNTQYVNLTMPVGFIFFPWNDVVGENGEEYAMYTDDFISTWFNVGNQTYEVKLQSSPAVKGLYRLVNPYGAAYPFNEPGDYDESTNHYMYFNCADPKKVFLCNAKGQANVGNSMVVFHTGMDWGYGEFIFSGMYNNAMAAGRDDLADQYAGQLVNGVVTFPEKALLARMDEYTEPGKWSYANYDSAFKIVFPGVVEEEPEVTWTQIGTGKFTDGILSPHLGLYPLTYEVEVEQNDDEPTQYRIVNPYMYGVMPDGLGMNYDPAEESYHIVIDAANPNCVKLVEQLVYEDDEFGEFYAYNDGWYYSSKGASDNAIIENHFNDVFSNNSIFEFRHIWTYYTLDEDADAEYDMSSVPTYLILNPTAATTAAMNRAAKQSKSTLSTAAKKSAKVMKENGKVPFAEL